MRSVDAGTLQVCCAIIVIAAAMQHPEKYATSLHFAWAALYRVYVKAVRLETVIENLRRHGGNVKPDWGVPPRPARSVAAPTVTIVDLDNFDADRYVAQLEAWCRATLVAWGMSPHLLM